ncbi:Pimeloyl-ACP methyl ester carboxylesterase [Streptomyces sp. TLI_053]|uniref:alpha/beta fold hydrolase n=1 Tax=Streptomyces sp. TLI_053 TaxID=1855352 RepID=UPI00087C138D|nr:alpha/beta hydrolase [Streptomyces sp. TLI_053]SDT23461.1 Pimeloyl-ACP methyl ester carboxylesterase [Streptomyces sp. TLI_053]
MRDTTVTPDGDRIRWVEVPGKEPVRLYLHGLGSSSPVYYAAAAAHPLLTGHRALLLDLLGFGISDRPTGFSYTLEAHADAVAAAVRAAGAEQVEVIGHSLGGAVAIVLAHRHPGLVGRLVLVDSVLDPVAPTRGPGGSGLASFTEEEYLAGGWEQVERWAGPFWWATMRLAGPEALHRSAVHRCRPTVPTLREQLRGIDVPRTFLHPEADGEPTGADALRESGVALVAVPDCGHNIMIDNPDGFAAATAAALA